MPTKREHFQHSLRAQILGEKMRTLREERGLTLKYIAAYLGVEFSTLARYERAEWPFRRDHVMALLDVYGVYDNRQRVELLDLAANAWRTNQWGPGYGGNSRSGAGDDLTIIDHWWIQSRAEELCVYASSLIPELLQTRDYAGAIIQRREPNSARVDKLVREQLVRQEVLEERPPKRLTALIEESVLTRPVGGRAVLEQQLEHLLRAVERPHVRIRVLPTRIGLHDGTDGPFTLCLMQRPYPPVALVEHLGGRLALEDVAADWYLKAFEKLSEYAASDTDSAGLIHEVIATITHHKPAKLNRSTPEQAGPEAVAA
jgi:transcriptional regulator with XRE-family HTH domain